jgi:hypothetical protein
MVRCADKLALPWQPQNRDAQQRPLARPSASRELVRIDEEAIVNILLWYLPYAMFSGVCDVVLAKSRTLIVGERWADSAERTREIEDETGRNDDVRPSTWWLADHLEGLAPSPPNTVDQLGRRVVHAPWVIPNRSLGLTR